MDCSGVRVYYTVVTAQIYHRMTFATIHNPAVYLSGVNLSGARVSMFGTLVPQLININEGIKNLAFPYRRYG